MPRAYLECVDFREDPSDGLMVRVGGDWYRADDLRTVIDDDQVEPICTIVDRRTRSGNVEILIGDAWLDYETFRPAFESALSAQLLCVDYRVDPGPTPMVKVGPQWYAATELADLVDADTVTPVFLLVDQRTKGATTEVLIGRSWHDFADLATLLSSLAASYIDCIDFRFASDEVTSLRVSTKFIPVASIDDLVDSDLATPIVRISDFRSTAETKEIQIAGAWYSFSQLEEILEPITTEVLFFRDPFTVASTIDLADHTPPIDGSGMGWQIDAGGFDVISATGRLQSVGSAPAGGAWLATVDSGDTAGSWSARVGAVAGTPSALLMFRYIDADNYWRFGVTFPNRFRVWQRVGASSSTVFDVSPVTLLGGGNDVLSVEYDDAGFAVSLNGEVMFELASAVNNSGTRVGVTTFNNQAFWDDCNLRRSVPALSRGSMLYRDGGGWVPFVLQSEDRLGFGALAPRTSAGDALDFTLEDFAGNEIATSSRVFQDAGLDVVPAAMSQVTNESPAIVIPAGTYRMTATVDSAAPTAMCVRRADSATRHVPLYGFNSSSGQYVMEDSDGSLVYAGVAMGEGYNRFLRKDGEAPVELDWTIPAEALDFSHQSHVVEQAAGNFCSFSCNHLRQLVAGSAPTLSGLAQATPHNLDESEATYIHTAVDIEEEIWLHTRGNNSRSVFMHFPDPADLSNHQIDVLLDNQRIQPRGTFAMQKDDGGRLIVTTFGRRFNNDWRNPWAIAVYDPSVGTAGQWYSPEGVAIDGNESYGVDGTDRFQSAQWFNQAYSFGGTLLVLESAPRQQIPVGKPAVRVKAWNATTKDVQIAALWSDHANSAAADRTPCNLRLTVGRRGPSILTVTDDPFGLDPQPFIRDAVGWWDGDDVIFVIVDRDGVAPEYHYSNDVVNTYYDRSGSVLRVYRITDPTAASSAADLKARISLRQTFTYDQLGGGRDTKGQPIGITGVSRLGTTGSRIYFQIGSNALDVVQKQATIKVLDVSP